jgi:hypothetical protein
MAVSQIKRDDLPVHEDLSRFIRDLTPQEIDTFNRDGWVFAPAFIKPELCEMVIDRYARWSGLRWRAWPDDPAEQRALIETIDKFAAKPKWHYAIRQEDPWMFNYVCQRKLGEAIARLLAVPSVKPLTETLHVKYPETSGRSRGIPWHQDFPSLPVDRAEAAQFWLALVPITPEMGPMVHLTGSHHSIPGGMVGETGEDARDLYPDLFRRYTVSEPRAYAPGDAVFHHCLTWHSSGLNMTDKVRWAMSSYRISARSCYTGQVNFNTDGLGLVPRKPFDHANFPTVYP